MYIANSTLMKREHSDFLIIEKETNGIKVAFREINKLTVLNAPSIKLGLIDIVTKRNTQLEIDLKGIKFIDSAIIDTLNLLSRMARRYNSRIILINVSDELSELLALVKMHAVFDIQRVLPEMDVKPVA
jgi:anti-anti-sigma factor